MLSTHSFLTKAGFKILKCGIQNKATWLNLGTQSHYDCDIIYRCLYDVGAGIYVKFRGEAYVRWSEGSGDDTKSYSDREQYFKEKRLLFGSGNIITFEDIFCFTFLSTYYNFIFFSGQRGSEIKLGQGQYIYPFQFLLPTNIPATFKRGDGSIKYWVKAEIVRSFAFDIKQTRYFNVSAGIPELSSLSCVTVSFVCGFLLLPRDSIFWSIWHRLRTLSWP